MDNEQEQMQDVVQRINMVVAEREKFYQQLGNLMKESELLQTIVIPYASVFCGEGARLTY